MYWGTWLMRKLNHLFFTHVYHITQCTLGSVTKTWVMMDRQGFLLLLNETRNHQVRCEYCTKVQPEANMKSGDY